MPYSSYGGSEVDSPDSAAPRCPATFSSVSFVTTAYLDTSFVLTIALEEAGAGGLRRVLSRYDELLSSDLIVAECLSAARREGILLEEMLATLRAVQLVLPPRSLAPEMREVLEQGHLRGADLWHVACALSVTADTRADCAFLSRDQQQRRIANRLGFPTP